MENKKEKKITAPFFVFLLPQRQVVASAKVQSCSIMKLQKESVVDTADIIDVLASITKKKDCKKIRTCNYISDMISQAWSQNQQAVFKKEKLKIII